MSHLTTPIPFASLLSCIDESQRISSQRTLNGRRQQMTQAATAKKARLGTLLLALVGCVVVAVPMVYSLAEPVPMTLIGCGVSTIALALFLFFSL
jgi:hypothetical protein